jgi:hypothetical protein
MGLRDDMVERALEFRKALAAQDKAMGGDGTIRYLFLGDLNCMGMKYPFDRSIPSDIELKKWDRSGLSTQKNKMRRLVKSHDFSWSNGSHSSIPDSNLDHVFATENLHFRAFLRDDGTPAEAKVTGWADFNNDPTKKDKWIKDFSDHSLIYLEIVA